MLDAYNRTSVRNEKGVHVSGCDISECTTREDMLEAYAKGCGWRNAEQMRTAYPIDQYQFIQDCLTCGNEHHAHLVCSHCGSGA